MLRVRFRANIEDPRPIHWPVKHPFWVTGETIWATKPIAYATVVSYADDEAYILENWPEASHLEIEERDAYTFTDRFPMPDWFTLGPDTTKESIPMTPTPETHEHTWSIAIQSGATVVIVCAEARGGCGKRMSQEDGERLMNDAAASEQARQTAEDLRVAVLELKEHLGDSGDYSIVFKGGKPMGIGEYFPVANILERIDGALAALAPDGSKDAEPKEQVPSSP